MEEGTKTQSVMTLFIFLHIMFLVSQNFISHFILMNFQKKIGVDENAENKK